MKTKSNNRLKVNKLGNLLLKILLHWVTTNTFYLSIGVSLVLQLRQLQTKGNITTLLLWLLIAELVLSLLALSFSTSCLINNFRNRVKIKKKHMIKFLSMFRDGVQLSDKKIFKLSEYSTDRTRLYFNILLQNNFLKECGTNKKPYKENHDDPLFNHLYGMDLKGLSFLKKHSELD